MGQGPQAGKEDLRATRCRAEPLMKKWETVKKPILAVPAPCLLLPSMARAAGSRDPLATPRGEAGFRQCAVQGGVHRDDPFLQVEGFADRGQGSLPPQGPHAGDIGRSSIELQGRQSLTYPRTGAGARHTLL